MFQIHNVAILQIISNQIVILTINELVLSIFTSTLNNTMKSSHIICLIVTLNIIELCIDVSLLELQPELLPEFSILLQCSIHPIRNITQMTMIGLW